MRTKIAKQIEAMVPHDEQEQLDQANVLAWIASGAEIFRLKKPDVPKQHLNTYFFIWDAEAKRTLIGEHVKSNLWLPGGGHVEPNEDPKDTVTRELKEEFGLEPEFIYPAPCFLTVTPTVGPTQGHTDVSLWFLLKGNAQKLPSFDPVEFRSLRWCSLDELLALETDPHMNRFVTKMNLYLPLTCSRLGTH